MDIMDIWNVLAYKQFSLSVDVGADSWGTCHNGSNDCDNVITVTAIIHQVLLRLSHADKFFTLIILFSSFHGL